METGLRTKLEAIRERFEELGDMLCAPEINANKAKFLALSREEFEISALHFDAETDAYTESVRANVDFFAHGERPAAEWAEVIAQRAPDVIVYLDIGMHPMPHMLGALRLAPVQAVLWGHPVTTGLDTIDYFLSSDAMEPADGDAHYTESLVRLRNVRSAYLNGCRPLGPISTFVRLEGKDCRDLALGDNDLHQAARPLDLADNAPSAAAVVPRERRMPAE